MFCNFLSSTESGGKILVSAKYHFWSHCHKKTSQSGSIALGLFPASTFGWHVLSYISGLIPTFVCMYIFININQLISLSIPMMRQAHVCALCFVGMNNSLKGSQLVTDSTASIYWTF